MSEGQWPGKASGPLRGEVSEVFRILRWAGNVAGIGGTRVRPHANIWL